MDEYNNTLDWGDSIEQDGSEFVTLDEGDYTFEVTKMERGDFPGSEKMCACPKATLTLKVTSDKGTTTIFDDLILHKRMEWKLSQFFRSIGQKKKGERVEMKWNIVEGSKGRAHIVVNTYTGKDGNEHTNNKVARYLDYDPELMPKDDGFMTIPDGAGDVLPFD